MQNYKNIFKIVAACLLYLFIASSAYGLPVDSRFWKGHRSTGEGIEGLGKWLPANGGFLLAWDIQYDNDMYAYEYTISDAAENSLQGDLSHWILEVTYPSSQVDFTGPISADSPKEWGNEGRSNPGIPSGIYGIKFDYGGGSPTYTFTTSKPPMWGDFYAKGGSDGNGGFNYAYNSGFGSDPNEGSVADWIAVPNSGSHTEPVPEPSTMLLFGTGLFGLAGLGRKTFGKKMGSSYNI